MFNHALDQIPILTFSTNDFRWLHWKDWTDEETTYFCEQRRQPLAQLFAQPPFFRHHDKTHLGVLSRWTVNDSRQGTAPVGWAEVQAVWGGFTKGVLFYSLQPDFGEAQNALSYLISVALMIGRFDLLTVAAADQHSLHKSGWGVEKQFYSLTSDAVLLKEKNPLSEYEVVVMDPKEWWRHEDGLRNRRALHYLETRIKRTDKKNACACPK